MRITPKHPQPLRLVPVTQDQLKREREFQLAVLDARLKQRRVKLEVVKGGRS